MSDVEGNFEGVRVRRVGLSFDPRRGVHHKHGKQHRDTNRVMWKNKRPTESFRPVQIKNCHRKTWNTPPNRRSRRSESETKTEKGNTKVLFRTLFVNESLKSEPNRSLRTFIEFYDFISLFKASSYRRRVTDSAETIHPRRFECRTLDSNSDLIRVGRVESIMYKCRTSFGDETKVSTTLLTFYVYLPRLDTVPSPSPHRMEQSSPSSPHVSKGRGRTERSTQISLKILAQRLYLTWSNDYDHAGTFH